MFESGAASPFILEKIFSVNKFSGTNESLNRDNIKKDRTTIAVLTNVLFFIKAAKFIVQYSGYGKDNYFISIFN